MSWPSLRPFCIGGQADPYLRRWFVIPRNKWFCVYLHQMLRDDDDRALHDHPAHNISIILKGGYHEVLSEKVTKRRWPGQIIFRAAVMPHRLFLPEGVKASWSLFIMFKKFREWGFWCPGGRWVHWRDFTAGENGEIVGKGCE